MTQEEIFENIKSRLPGSPRMASGGLPDVKSLSDVDISLLTDNPENVGQYLPEGTVVDKRQDRVIYSVPGYERPVNVYATSRKELADRAPQHRKIQLMLRMKYPELAALAREEKAGGLSTEEAWAKVLGLEGDPYQAMLNQKRVMEAASVINGEA